MNQDLIYKIAVTKIPNVGAVLAKQLISYCGGPEEVFKAKPKYLRKIPGIGPHMANLIHRQDPEELAIREVEFIEQNQIHPIYYLDKDYPFRLKQFPDCPVLLFYKGNAPLNHRRIVSIVGTRTPTARGKAICEELVESLKAYDAIVVSGLAYGIDVTTHQHCIRQDIPTIGVLGHGLRHIYPAQHASIARVMVNGGGLLTEYVSDTGPKREHFPMRNRIVAGMCDALIVVETGKKGGSMITAELANHYNKDVFAIPGRLTDQYSIGCNQLIKSHRAALLESIEDLAYIMRWEKMGAAQNGIQSNIFATLTPNEQSIVDLFQQNEQLSIDHLSTQLNLNSGEMASLLLEMEFKGMIKPLPGKQYMLVS
ncbi:MAG: DNA-processing protein DprA [Bacteroidota bacterium]